MKNKMINDNSNNSNNKYDNNNNSFTWATNAVHVFLTHCAHFYLFFTFFYPIFETMIYLNNSLTVCHSENKRFFIVDLNLVYENFTNVFDLTNIPLLLLLFSQKLSYGLQTETYPGHIISHILNSTFQKTNICLDLKGVFLKDKQYWSSYVILVSGWYAKSVVITLCDKVIVFFVLFFFTQISTEMCSCMWSVSLQLSVGGSLWFFPSAGIDFDQGN